MGTARATKKGRGKFMNSQFDFQVGLKKSVTSKKEAWG